MRYNELLDENRQYYYHGTVDAKLPEIKQKGLTISIESDWSKFEDDPDLGKWSIGKIFFSPTERQALFYAFDKVELMGSLLKAGNPRVLRVSSKSIKEPQHDIMGRGGDIYTLHAISPADIEILVGKKWVKLAPSGTVISENQKYYYHGSFKKLPVGTILSPRKVYTWKSANFYAPLERYRPRHMLEHKDAVFMCDNPKDAFWIIEGLLWMFTVEPLGKIEKHDWNWSAELAGLVEDDAPEKKIKAVALNYWNGVPYTGENLWEYLAPAARIVKVERY